MTLIHIEEGCMVVIRQIAPNQNNLIEHSVNSCCMKLYDCQLNGI